LVGKGNGLALILKIWKNKGVHKLYENKIAAIQ
jgi:hypothetical protein